ncbi:MAG: hypothetical protein WCS37_10745 [Chloroflexota bacterium]|nr:hypothetical protein [Chloroflexota bacterium]
MNSIDLEAFNRAIQLDHAGDKPAAHAILNKLRIYYPQDPNLLLWIAFTATNLGEAKGVLEAVSQLDPQNPSLASASTWITTLQNNKRQEKILAFEAKVAERAIIPPVHFKIPFMYRRQLEAELAKGEEVVWAAQPDLRHVMKDLLLKRVALGGPLLLVEVLAALLLGHPLVWFGIILIMLLTALGVFLSPYLLYKQASKTLYLLTNQRLILVGGAWLKPGWTNLSSADGIVSHNIVWKNFASYEHLELEKLTLVERPDGFGDILFEEKEEKKEDYDYTTPAPPKKAGCVYIKEAATIKALIEQVYTFKNSPDCPTSSMFWNSGE